ncbi:hypothetical protein [Chryseobacterium sp. SG20098]|uniref:hypothetical protein n=1 Tax=Chryseobacterium sp. SG20098 TaxID=3074145 RepID=UPI002882DBA2|nr:hypothetical protein [Chryseobacterium sp. SG20098]WNI34697.1 hypothetical protein RHP76_11940 [Chryseobacterium sp. SG20098]
MNKLIHLLIISIITISCASVEKNKAKEFQKITTETQFKGKESTELNSNSETRSESVSMNENVNFSITPNPGKIADFTFNFGGKLITGSTTGAINFSNQKTKSKKKTVIKTYTIEKRIRQWILITKKQIIYRIRTKTKVVTIDYPWYFWAILIPLIIALWEILKKYLPINFLKLLKFNTNDK